MNWTERVAGRLTEVRAKHPLVHNITNYVVMNSTANALLALGASPVMAHAEEEVAEMTRLSGALVLNIGTLSAPWITAMIKAANAAAKEQIPVILDPVGAGATQLRTQTAQALLVQCKLSAVRGNPSEVLAVAGHEARARGVESQHTVEQARAAAFDLAHQHHVTVAVSGAEDFVTDAQRVARIGNGHPLLTRVTGSGCAATAIIGAFCAVEPDVFAGVVEGLVVFGIAGELAARDNPRPGTYHVRLLDALDEISPEDIHRLARFEVS